MAFSVVSALSSTRRIAKEVAMAGLPVFWWVGSLSRVRTAMDTPFSFIPSRHTKGAVRHASLLLMLLSAAFADILSSAAKATDL